jgi:hypothetical protein
MSEDISTRVSELVGAMYHLDADLRKRESYNGLKMMVSDKSSKGGCQKVHLGRVLPMGETDRNISIGYRSLILGKESKQGKSLFLMERV